MADSAHVLDATIDQFRFDSHVALGAELQLRSTNEVKNEPMLFNCDPDFARQHGGPLTREFLDALTAEPDVIDTRVHMLMPGWFPAIPGFHHDDVPRPDGGQPDYDTAEYRSQHAFALVGDEVSCTQFALGVTQFPRPAADEIAYKVWHPMVDKMIADGQLEAWTAPMHRIVYFNDRAWHQAVPATAPGWRWFARASWNTDRKPSNEVRAQVQVYLENPMEGW